MQPLTGILWKGIFLYYVNDIRMTDRTMQNSSKELGYLLAAYQQQYCDDSVEDMS